jgi:hypothetical protein
MTRLSRSLACLAIAPLPIAVRAGASTTPSPTAGGAVGRP